MYPWFVPRFEIVAHCFLSYPVQDPFCQFFYHIISNSEPWNSLIFTESHGSWGHKASVKIISSNQPGESSITTKSRFPRITSTWVLNICRDGDSTRFLSKFWVVVFECLLCKFPNWNSAQILFFPSPHYFPHSHIHNRKAQKTDTCLLLSHRLQRTQTCLSCSISFDSGVPTAPSQHLHLIYSVLLKQILTGSFSIPVIPITTSDFPCFT